MEKIDWLPADSPLWANYQTPPGSGVYPVWGTPEWDKLPLKPSEKKRLDEANPFDLESSRGLAGDNPTARMLLEAYDRFVQGPFHWVWLLRHRDKYPELKEHFEKWDASAAEREAYQRSRFDP